MNIATRGVLASLVGIGLLTTAHAAAEPDSPAGGQESPAEKQAGGSKLKPVAEPAESTDPAPISDLIQAESCQPGETSWLDDEPCGESLGGPSCAVCGGGSCSPPMWYTEQGISVLTRGRPRRTDLTSRFQMQTIDAQLVGGPAGQLVNFKSITPFVMSTRAVSFDIASGYSVTVGRYLGRDTENRDHFIEAQYEGMHDWVESKTVTGRLQPVYENDDPFSSGSPPDIIEYTGSLLSPFPEYDPEVFRPELAATIQALDNSFNNVERHSIDYRSRLDNVELNARIRPRARSDRLVLHPNGHWRRECQPGEYTSYLFGFRLISMDENFGWFSQGTLYQEASPVQPPTANPAFVYDGSYEVRTHNDLIGLQFGGDYMVRRCKWTWGMRAKMGPFFNFMDQSSRIIADETQLSSNPPFNPVTQIRRADIRRAARKNGASLLGELGFVGSYKLYPNMTVRASYDFMWITGLALAPEQLIFEPDPPARVNDNGHAYFHGLTLSAEYAW